MNTTDDSSESGLAVQGPMQKIPEPLPSRRDLVRATLIEIGIATQEIRGTDRAAEYLKSQGIDLDIAVRVLSRPMQRRR